MSAHWGYHSHNGKCNHILLYIYFFRFIHFVRQQNDDFKTSFFLKKYYFIWHWKTTMVFFFAFFGSKFSLVYNEILQTVQRIQIRWISILTYSCLPIHRCAVNTSINKCLYFVFKSMTWVEKSNSCKYSFHV